MVKEIRATEFDNEVLNSQGLVIVDFFATWCGPCQMLAPVLDKIVDDKNINLFKIDIDKNSDLAMKYDVEAVPTVVFFKDGNEVDRFLGVHSKDEIVELIEKWSK